MYEPRTYRHRCCCENLVSSFISVKETDLYILAEKNLKLQAREMIIKYRTQIEDYIKKNQAFLTSLTPLPDDQEAPPIIKSMMLSSKIAHVGPMAAVAGAIAEFVGKNLLQYSSQVIIENGGDIFLHSKKKRRIQIVTGNSPFRNKLILEISPTQCPIGICTSSGTLGHSFSFGKADAVVILSSSTPLADAVATAIGNIVQTKNDIEIALKKTKAIKEITGIIIIKDDCAGFWGEIKIVNAQ